MNRKVFIYQLFAVVLFAVTNGVTAQNLECHHFKTDIQINDLFKGNGLVCERVGYEYTLSEKRGNSIGLWIGGHFKTSKLNIGDEGKATTDRKLQFAIDYYHFLLKHPNNNGVYLSPALYYNHGLSTIDSNQEYNIGIDVNLGYRLHFKPIMIDCVLFSGYDYGYQENDTYNYRNRMIKTLNIKIIIGFMF
jgi:hypothetical protein